jgi:hypothetical protein
MNKTAYNESMKKRRLPLGVQAFSKIREAECVYADKTERIYQLVTEAIGPVFLARPRRFGKSLLCSTLAALFEGRRGSNPKSVTTDAWYESEENYVHEPARAGTRRLCAMPQKRLKKHTF